jgi:hypothetical protein
MEDTDSIYLFLSLTLQQRDGADLGIEYTSQYYFVTAVEMADNSSKLGITENCNNRKDYTVLTSWRLTHQD